MRVLLAFDKFKGSLTAQSAGSVTARVLRDLHPDWSIELAPVTDGGEGFVSILTHAGKGEMKDVMVSGPRGQMVAAQYGLVTWSAIPEAVRIPLGLPENLAPQTQIAIIEMAQASGLSLLQSGDRNPWQTTTHGTGELISEAVKAGVEAVILGVGGSATNDLGLGALGALGLHFHSNAGEEINPAIPARWSEIERISGSLPKTLPTLYIACDVTNPLLGAQGAAAIYGPQKGLPAGELDRMERESERMARMLCAYFDSSAELANTPGAGAAGGIAFGLMVGAKARLVPGFALVSAWLDLERKIKRADVVITGEGCFDASSSQGKGPGAVVDQALANGKPVFVFAGKITAPLRNNMELHAITDTDAPLEQAMADGAKNLEATVRRVFSPSHSIL